ncbi:2668_t:CDS:1 [Funneliformis geosporum]|uniref:13686_t:CDS:1 n=1 Tax=Funneliformis geosporum TaxID=1117311 RepID=A0A9W4SRS7_9GLOM|nr:2668_t:CDS:1 [Funneliformis geosporum]CAI2178162.1 13686_t:CDS:1 [Funneliformis geosporum]
MVNSQTKLLFQQLLNHRNDKLKATDLNGHLTTDVHIQFKHFIALEKGQLAPETQHSQSLVHGFAKYPRFDIIIGRMFIQISVSSFDQHNKDSAEITKSL